MTWTLISLMSWQFKIKLCTVLAKSIPIMSALPKPLTCRRMGNFRTGNLDAIAVTHPHRWCGAVVGLETNLDNLSGEVPDPLKRSIPGPLKTKTPEQLSLQLFSYLLLVTDGRNNGKGHCVPSPAHYTPLSESGGDIQLGAGHDFTHQEHSSGNLPEWRERGACKQTALWTHSLCLVVPSPDLAGSPQIFPSPSISSWLV